MAFLKIESAIKRARSLGHFKRLSISLVLLSLCFVGSAHASHRLIVKFKDSDRQPQAHAQPQITKKQKLLHATLKAGASSEYVRPMSNDAHVIELPGFYTEAGVQEVLRNLRQQVDIQYADIDARKFPTLTPNDTFYSQAWHLYEANGGIRADQAWDVTTGSASVVVAVLDTGITNHSEFSGRILPGYDFISDVATANDGDGRDADPSDPGDWVTAGEATLECPQEDSSWHGTLISGVIAARGNNGVGVTGINWNARILPARVLGKCGGFTSDIVDAMRWAAGFSVPGVADNPNPARIINVSLGGFGACSSLEQDAINELRQAGAIVIASAGNGNVDVANFSPANCSGVVAVAATGRTGARASYSNFGSGITISAPGGDFDFLPTTSNTGTTTPVANPGGDDYVFYQGTSAATAVVTGVVSLMLSVNPSLSVDAIISLLQSSARPFPDATCTTAICGAGIVNAYAAVLAAQSYVSPSSGGGGGGGGGAFHPLMLLILLLILTGRRSLRAVSRCVIRLKRG